MPKKSYVLLMLSLMLASCSQVVPSEVSTIHKEAINTVCGDFQDTIYLDPDTMSTDKGSQVNAVLAGPDGTSYFFGQYIDANTSRTYAFINKYSPTLEPVIWGYAEVTPSTNTTYKRGDMTTHTAAAFSKYGATTRVVIVGNMQETGKAYQSGVVLRLRSTEYSGWDTTFANSGERIVTFGTAAGNKTDLQDVITEATGKTVVVGTFYSSSSTPSTRQIAVARLNNDGTFDTTFGNGGKILVPNSSGMDGLKIETTRTGYVILSKQNNNVKLLRLNAAGQPETSSGIPIMTFDLGGNETPTDLIRRSDGTIAVTGITQATSGTSTNPVSVFFATYLDNMQPFVLTSFGANYIIHNAWVRGEEINAWATEMPFNQLMLSGSTADSFMNRFYSLLFKTAQLNTSFGNTGVLEYGPGHFDAQSSGVIVHSVVNAPTVTARILNAGSARVGGDPWFGIPGQRTAMFTCRTIQYNG